MKKILVSLTISLAILFVGCGAKDTPRIESIPSEEQRQVEEQERTQETEPTQDARSTQEPTPVAGSEAGTNLQESSELTFADLAKRQFEFSSGAGAWSEDFVIEKDGYFHGRFGDSDMGVTGEGYEDGTRYACSYSGHFVDLVKINEYTYEMKMADISYDDPVGTEKISDKIRYIYTDSYCLGDTDTFRVYLPGTPLQELSEEVRIWLLPMNQSETELTMIAIVDETNGYGIYSYERMDPLEDARMMFSAYKESYDYYGELLKDAVTTAEMVEYSASMYEVSDQCLNDIWNLVRYNVEEEQFQKILTEQREWIAAKEEAGKEACAEYEGGSFAAVSYNDTLASLTIERCEELIAYLE